MRNIYRSIVFIAAALAAPMSASPQKSTPDIRAVVEAKLKGSLPKGGLAARCPIYDDWVAARVFTEYGAMFVADKPVVVPSKCMVESDAQMAAVQSLLNAGTAQVAGVTVTLQEPALKAFLDARAEAAKAGLAITPRGGSIASTRSYSNTVGLWNSRFEPALAYWVRKGRIKRAESDAVQDETIRKQVEAVLMWEQEGIWFSKSLSKSVLYSVAIPGASQHNFMLALDIEQFSDPRVRRIMADHGWFQTVKSDFPHFTYLGLKEADLPGNGLRSVVVGGQTFWVPNIIEAK
jgi:hypothetical protein